MNALLSFLYTLLVHDVQAALETVGLDPQVGFLHQDRPGRPGLALDMMEELRPFLADRLALSLVNRRQVSSSGLDVYKRQIPAKAPASGCESLLDQAIARKWHSGDIRLARS